MDIDQKYIVKQCYILYFKVFTWAPHYKIYLAYEKFIKDYKTKDNKDF